MLTKLIEELLLHGREKEATRTYIGASLIGRECLRSIWYEYNHYPAAPFTAKQLMTFEIGHALEENIISILRDKIYCANRPQDYVIMSMKNTPRLCSKNNEIEGTPDATLIISGKSGIASTYILEIKTANNASFNQFVKHGLRRWREQYYAQLQAYLGITCVPQGILLAINKDSAEIHEEVVEFNELYYEMLLVKARAIKNATEPPPRMSENPMTLSCKLCKYKETCFKLYPC